MPVLFLKSLHKVEDNKQKNHVLITTANCTYSRFNNIIDRTIEDKSIIIFGI